MYNFKFQSIFYLLYIYIDNFFVCFSMKKLIFFLFLKDFWLYLLYLVIGWGGLVGVYNKGKSVVIYSNVYKKKLYYIIFLGWVEVGDFN